MSKSGLVTSGVALGPAAVASFGVLDQPHLLLWLGLGSLAGGMVSLAMADNDKPESRRSILALLGQFGVGLSTGVFCTPIALVWWLPDGPYRAEHVAGIAFGASFSAWHAIKLAWPILATKGKSWLRNKLEPPK